MALKFTVHGVQSFIKGHRKSGVISIKHSRDITNQISPHTVRFLPVTATHTYVSLYVVNGTTGESMSLTVTERKQLTQEWIKIVNGRCV